LKKCIRYYIEQDIHLRLEIARQIYINRLDQTKSSGWLWSSLCNDLFSIRNIYINELIIKTALKFDFLSLNYFWTMVWNLSVKFDINISTDIEKNKNYNYLFITSDVSVPTKPPDNTDLDNNLYSREIVLRKFVFN